MLPRSCAPSRSFVRSLACSFTRSPALVSGVAIARRAATHDFRRQRKATEMEDATTLVELCDGRKAAARRHRSSKSSGDGQRRAKSAAQSSPRSAAAALIYRKRRLKTARAAAVFDVAPVRTQLADVACRLRSRRAPRVLMRPAAPARARCRSNAATRH